MGRVLRVDPWRLGVLAADLDGIADELRRAARLALAAGSGTGSPAMTAGVVRALRLAAGDLDALAVLARRKRVEAEAAARIAGLRPVFGALDGRRSAWLARRSLARSRPAGALPRSSIWEDRRHQPWAGRPWAQPPIAPRGVTELHEFRLEGGTGLLALSLDVRQHLRRDVDGAWLVTTTVTPSVGVGAGPSGFVVDDDRIPKVAVSAGASALIGIGRVVVVRTASRPDTAALARIAAAAAAETGADGPTRGLTDPVVGAVRRLPFVGGVIRGIERTAHDVIDGPADRVGGGRVVVADARLGAHLGSEALTAQAEGSLRIEITSWDDASGAITIRAVGEGAAELSGLGALDGVSEVVATVVPQTGRHGPSGFAHVRLVAAADTGDQRIEFELRRDGVAMPDAGALAVPGVLARFLGDAGRGGTWRSRIFAVRTGGTSVGAGPLGAEVSRRQWRRARPQPRLPR